MRRREAAASPRPASVIWTVCSHPPPPYSLFNHTHIPYLNTWDTADKPLITGIAAQTAEAEEEDEDDE